MRTQVATARGSFPFFSIVRHDAVWRMVANINGSADRLSKKIRVCTPPSAPRAAPRKFQFETAAPGHFAVAAHSGGLNVRALKMDLSTSLKPSSRAPRDDVLYPEFGRQSHNASCKACQTAMIMSTRVLLNSSDGLCVSAGRAGQMPRPA